ncbi:shikimate kinase [Actinopolyspora saharensis]|uniref:Shikimate kinase n=1 Tax=Actinopolyspora saharensis TaxID=995062 RepID=A0A1H0Y5M8_9ACTN|nr:shikimate kinase [Actinopolyspora saharensis]SDQ10370.1 shikimate kinase [Actinopolyspora saharensis]
MTPRLVIVGPPGAGKTVVGRLLAERYGVGFRDTDSDAERLVGRPIPEIFTVEGESAFREIEERAVAEALGEHTGVLALGGGAVMAEGTRKLLADRPVLFLSVGFAEGVRRTGLSAPRPLLTGVNPRATFQALLRDRLPLYREVADWEVDTDELDPETVVERAVLRMGDAAAGGVPAE